MGAGGIRRSAGNPGSADGVSRGVSDRRVKDRSCAPSGSIVSAPPRPADFRGRDHDAVFDTFGAFLTEAVADGGRYASIATQAGPVPDLSARGVRTTVHQVREDGAGLGELARLVDDGALRLRVHAAYGLQDIRAAHERFREGGLTGKIVVTF